MAHCDSLTPKGVDLVLQPPHQKQPPSSCTHSIEYAVSWSIAVASVDSDHVKHLEIHIYEIYDQGFMENFRVPETSTILQRTGLRPVPQNMRQPVVLGSAQLRIRAVGQSLSSAVARPQLLSLKSQDNKIFVSARSELPRCPECLLRHVFAVIAFTVNGSKDFVSTMCIL